MTVTLHSFPEEFQRCFAIPAFGHITFQHLPFVINGAPKKLRLAVDLHKDFVQVRWSFRFHLGHSSQAYAALKSNFI